MNLRGTTNGCHAREYVEQTLRLTRSPTDTGKREE